MKKTSFHGSDLERVEKEFGIKKEDIVNFAANVSPLGASDYVKDQLIKNISVISRYPDRDYVALRQSIANYCHTNMEHIVVGSGSTELIAIMAKFIKPQKALILGPTYSEYEKEIGLNGGDITYFALTEGATTFTFDFEAFESLMDKESFDLFVICNPNNPTSSALNKEELSEIFSICERHHCFVMVDETYVEFSKDYEDITCVDLTDKHKNFIVLRGVSKFFCAPGLRLGYGVTGNEELLETIRNNKQPWSVNSLAEIAGISMYTDKDYIRKTKNFMQQEQTRMFEVFKDSGKYKPYECHANFILLKILDESENAYTLFERCIKEGCMIRNCDSFTFLSDRYIRFCFMNQEDNDKLVSILLR